MILFATLVLLLETLDANNLVQLLTVALIAAAAFPVLRNKSKDSTIEALRSSTEARMERIKDLESDLRGCKARADEEHERRREAERRVSKLEGQLEEQSKYTAPAAFETIVKELASMRATIGESISSQGELILKLIEVTARLEEILNPVKRPDSRK